MNYEDRRRSFVGYLKERQRALGTIPADFLNSLSDDDILEAYRKNHDGSDLYSVEQERGVLMEFDSDVTVYDMLERMKRLNHIDAIEAHFLIGANITISHKGLNAVKLGKLIKGFARYRLDVSFDGVDRILKNVCTFFASTVLEGQRFFITEFEPLKFAITKESVCPGCYLNEALSRYHTLAGWGWCTHAGESEEDKRSLKKSQTKLLEVIFDETLNLLNPEDDSLSGDKRFEKLLDGLNDLIAEYIMPLPLISCWLHGKDRALQQIDNKEELIKVHAAVNERFVVKYEQSLKMGTINQFFKDVEVFLKTLPLPHLWSLYLDGFPIDMMRRHQNKIEKILVTMIAETEEVI